MSDPSDVHENVRHYYGKELTQSSDLQTNACCTIEVYPKAIRDVLSSLHDEVLAKYYGCGLTIPDAIEGCRLLDLGCGSGRDVYLAGQLVGPEGSVLGIDMTEEQLAVAKRHLEYHKKKFAFSNVSFQEGNIDFLEECSLPPGQFDIIISNCVINLCHNKQNVLRQCFNLLSEGGEMYFSDVYASRRIPRSLQEDPILYGECLSGALYWNDFLTYAKLAGFKDPRVVSWRPIELKNKAIENKCEGIDFYSVTYRLFKIKNLETDCEDYGQSVRYQGALPSSPKALKLDDHHTFEQGRVEKVCGNTFRMLKETRYQKFFDFFGNFSGHYGIFEDCGRKAPFEKAATKSCC